MLNMMKYVNNIPVIFIIHIFTVARSNMKEIMGVHSLNKIVTEKIKR